eukprot:SAG11_NODE_163_length_13928_cov_29.869188_15_plen_64_part_00
MQLSIRYFLPDLVSYSVYSHPADTLLNLVRVQYLIRSTSEVLNLVEVNYKYSTKFSTSEVYLN